MNDAILTSDEFIPAQGQTPEQVPTALPATTQELRKNPTTGALELAPRELTSAPPRRRSYRKSTSQESLKKRGLYQSIVLLDGHKVFVLELGADQVERLKDAEKAFDIEMKRIVREQKQKRIKPLVANDLSTAAMEARGAVQYAELRRVIVDWELPDDDAEQEDAILPCTDETINDLPFSAAADLSKLILQVSKLGKSEGDFLATSSDDGSEE